MDCKVRGVISVALWVAAAGAYLFLGGPGFIAAMVLGLISGLILAGCKDPMSE